MLRGAQGEAVGHGAEQRWETGNTPAVELAEQLNSRAD